MEIYENIVSHLAGWRLDKRKDDAEWRRFLIGPNGERVIAMVQGGRLVFSGEKLTDIWGCWVNWKACGAVDPRKNDFRITCDRNRPPRDIAEDLKGRLLNHYIPAVALARKQKVKEEQEHARLMIVFNHILRILGGKSWRSENRSKRRYFIFKGGRGEIHHYDPPSIKLEFNDLNYDDALKLAGYFSEHIAKKDG